MIESGERPASTTGREWCRNRRAAGSLLLALALVLLSGSAGAAGKGADWRFGHIAVTNLKGGFWIHCSLLNSGNKSSETSAGREGCEAN